MANTDQQLGMFGVPEPTPSKRKPLPPVSPEMIAHAADQLALNPQQLTVMTASLFVMNLTDGRLPHSRACFHQATVDEECRLLYVAVTRARHVLYLTYPARLHNASRDEYEGQCCRFLNVLTSDDVDRSLLP